MVRKKMPATGWGKGPTRMARPVDPLTMKKIVGFTLRIKQRGVRWNDCPGTRCAATWRRWHTKRRMAGLFLSGRAHGRLPVSFLSEIKPGRRTKNNTGSGRAFGVACHIGFGRVGEPKRTEFFRGGNSWVPSLVPALDGSDGSRPDALAVWPWVSGSVCLFILFGCLCSGTSFGSCALPGLKMPVWDK